MAILKKHKNKITTYVLPTLVPIDTVFSNVNNEDNIVEITSKYNNNSILIGKGAGMEPTALSVVKDIVNIDENKVYIFNDWTFASSPSIRPFDHPVYDIWLKKCYS